MYGMGNAERMSMGQQQHLLCYYFIFCYYVGFWLTTLN